MKHQCQCGMWPVCFAIFAFHQWIKESDCNFHYIGLQAFNCLKLKILLVVAVLLSHHGEAVRRDLLSSCRASPFISRLGSRQAKAVGRRIKGVVGDTLQRRDGLDGLGPFGQNEKQPMDADVMVMCGGL